MANYTRIICLFILSLLAAASSVSMQAADARLEAYHFGYVSLGGGYTSLTQNVQNVSTRGGMALLGGAGYEFRCRGFWLSAGAQYLIERTTTTVNTHEMYLPGKDNQDPPRDVTFHYLIDQVDKQDWRTIDIPIQVGYYISGFYIGAGAKVGFSAGSSITTTGSYELRGKYKEYVGELKDVNFYTTYPVADTRVKCVLRPQFSIIGEMGYDILASVRNRNKMCNIVKVGVYFEYGLRTVRPTDSLDPLQFKVEDNLTIANEATINPYYLNEKTIADKIVPYMVGLKITYMLGGNPYDSRTAHRGCQCYDE